MDTNTPQSQTPPSQEQKPFIEEPVIPDPTHEAYTYEKATEKKTVVAQGSEREIKYFVKMNRAPGRWLYMREIQEGGNGDQVERIQVGRQRQDDNQERVQVGSQIAP